MKRTYFEKFNSEALKLFEEIRETLKNSGDEALSSKAKDIPTMLYGEDGRINIVFAGQYSAGKSSLISLLTGKELEIGGGVTTSECQSFDWQGVTITDTPGIHTQNRPDHDAITYEQLSKADLILFVITAEGFSENLASHFRKLVNEMGKGHEMMLVVNKMDQTADGNTETQQKVLIDKDIMPVLDPYTVEDMYTTFISTEWYRQSLLPKYEKYKERLEEKSGFNSFIENLNRFVSDKGLLGSTTTSLYETEKILSDLISDIKTGDEVVDGALHMLNRKRGILVDSKNRIRERVDSAVKETTHKVKQYGVEIAGTLSSVRKQEETNKLLAEKQQEVENQTEILTAIVEEILNSETSKLRDDIEDLAETAFAKMLTDAIVRKAGTINMSDKRIKNVEKASGYLMDASSIILTMATKSAGSGSQLYTTVLKVGSMFSSKFNPWKAVRWTQNITTCGRVLGVVGSALSVGLQIYNDKQEDKVERQLLEGRNEIRTCFADAADAIDLEYDKATNSWIQQQIDSKIEEIDRDIDKINSCIKNSNELYSSLSNLLWRVRLLISEIQTSC